MKFTLEHAIILILAIAVIYHIYNSEELIEHYLFGNDTNCKNSTEITNESNIPLGKK